MIEKRRIKWVAVGTIIALDIICWAIIVLVVRALL